MNLHLDKDNFEGAIVATADYFEIPEIFIEKDYWVTYALHQLFHSEVKDLIVFKGVLHYPNAMVLLSDFRKILISLL
ncbi:hypothetical protein [Flavobacterium sp. 5]|uniref:hypothetical protein n=1 Tax=Flavobacterium sp. 5 TaxID=2035199 RepID=UPI001E3DA650|nr:hypothetical protein [Flavobacterium sp. 5]